MSDEGGLGLTVVVPAYDEEAVLPRTVASLATELQGEGPTWEIVVVDDGSRDRTGEVAEEIAEREPGVRVVHQENQGIGGAFRTGISLARGQWILLWPADMECTPGALSPYLGRRAGDIDIIVGCRRARVGYNPLMRLNAWVYPWIVNLLFGLSLGDVNWICLYRSRVIKGLPITQNGIPMLTELLVGARDGGATFLEVDVDMLPRVVGRPSAGRLSVMWRTLMGLLAFWWSWRRGGGRPT